MSRLQAFDRELSERDSDGKDSWYDSGVLFVGQLEADLAGPTHRVRHPDDRMAM